MNIRYYQFLYHVFQASYPVISKTAMLYRRSLGRNTRIIAIVGSFGKSTAKRSILAALGLPFKIKHQRNSGSFLARAVLQTSPHEDLAVHEVGIKAPDEMASYAKMLLPSITVVTSIGSDHNRSLKNLEITRTEKAEMVRILPSSGVAILNGDDPNVLWMRNQTNAQVITFGLNSSNDIYATDIHIDWPNGTVFNLHHNGEKYLVRSKLIGKPMVYSILSAITVALVEKIPIKQVLPALGALSPTQSRLEPIPLQNDVYILNDAFKSALETVNSALDVLAQIPAKRKVVITGEIEEPPSSQSKIYPALGAKIAGIADKIIYIGSKKTYALLKRGALQNGLSPAAIFYAKRDVLAAINMIRQDLKPGDVILVKGRGSIRLERIVLALQDKIVNCKLDYCNIRLRCMQCPLLKGNTNKIL